ncbi:hypothetical protein [Halorubellus sp. JP-L1]|uniref:hypothetical protein n=1 Tax=Halorubellus sp. JP-L1 TaxID=2715753 RepID=UPI001962BE8A|nr:hypothetical protein [Halorubellus sp. JP-L1]
MEWHEEYDVGGTPVDVVGVLTERAGERVLVVVELEVRRADPANNTVKLLRNLDAGVLDAYDRVVVCQVFSAYYDLASGGVSTKRENAAFVGRLAADAYERVTYRAVDLPVTPPKRGNDPPREWRAGVDAAVDATCRALDDAADHAFDADVS